MSFLGLSRKNETGPWGCYVCLDEEDCKMIIGSIRGLHRRKEKAAERLRDLHDGGEASTRLDTEMMKAWDREERASQLVSIIEKYLHL